MSAQWLRLVGLMLLASSCEDEAVFDFPCDLELACPGTLRCDEDSHVCIPGVTCNPPRVECAGSCADLTSSRSHCGACGRACTSDETCVDAACQPTPVDTSCFCLPGLECVAGKCSCSGRGELCSEALCFDLQQSSLSCGACLQFCTISGTECRAGVCTCPSGQKPCGDACRDVSSDPANCGACGAACAGGQKCERGLCVTACTINTANACGDGKCWDLEADERHCGANCRSCPTRQTCAAGVCTCTGGTSCSGQCTSLETDPLNCGACGTRCGLGEACVASACVCQTGLARCGTECVSLTSQSNCGACGQACATGLSCAQGLCVNACPVTVERCPDGLCADTGNDPRNCGGCGQACNEGESCVDGDCARLSAAVGCTSCPCDTCTFGAEALCCMRGGAPFCVKSERCPR